MTSAVTLAVILALAPALPEGVASLDVPELPPDWHTMVDPMDPMASSLFVDAFFDDIPPNFVTNTCLLESGCRKAIGVHKGDRLDARGRRNGRTIYKKLVKWKRIDPTCRHHKPNGRGDWYDLWSTVGNHGMMVGYNWRRVGKCFPREWFEIPLVSAIAAGRKARRVCNKLKAKGEPCAAHAIRLEWAQASTKKKRARVVKIWDTRLAKHHAARTSIDWEHPPTKADYMSNPPNLPSKKSNLPTATNRQLRDYVDEIDDLEVRRLRLRANIVVDITEKEAELKTLKANLDDLDRGLHRASSPEG